VPIVDERSAVFIAAALWLLPGGRWRVKIALSVLAVAATIVIAVGPGVLST
jgi:hypothetical protein